MKQLMKFILLSAVVFLLFACGVFSGGSTLDGTYCGKFSGIKVCYIFKPNGKMYNKVMDKLPMGMELLKMEIEVNYEVDGNKIRLLHPQGTVLLTILEDGSIEFMDVRFIKQ